MPSQANTLTASRPTPTDSELGRHLLTIRGLQWVFGAYGDPYALILRAEDDDPVDLGRQARERGPVYRSDTSVWVTTDRKVGEAVLRDGRLGPRHAGPEAPREHIFQNPWEGLKLCHVVPLDDAYLTLDSGEYAELRRLLTGALGTVDVASAAETETALALADITDATFDLFGDVAWPVAVGVIARLLEIPPNQRERFGQLCAALRVTLDAPFSPPRLDTARALQNALVLLRDVLAYLMERRRTQPGDDLISSVQRASDDGKALAAGVLVVAAGVEVTANLIANSVAALMREPGWWSRVAKDPSLAAGVVTETLRYDPPVRLESRIAHEGLDLGGTEIEADGQVVVLTQAADRDPATYADPDRFDPTREGPEPLASSSGTCAGVVAPLAQAVAQTVVSTVAGTFPGLRAAGEPTRRMRSPVVRGLLTLPVRSTKTGGE